jgi:hypothetical protein
MRWRASKLHRRQSGSGEQQQTKFCHDGLGPRKILGRKAWIGGRAWAGRLVRTTRQQGLAINEQALGRIVAGFEGGFLFISEDAKPLCAFVH